MASKQNEIKSIASYYETFFLTEKDIQKLDPTVIYLVFGYIRNAKLSVADAIALICLAYYFFDDNEYFANAHADYCAINSEKEISIEMITDDKTFPRWSNLGSAFGNVLIQSQFGGVYVWKFKIMQISKCSIVSIGLCTEFEDTNVDFYDIEHGHNYALSSHGSYIKNWDYAMERPDAHAFGQDDIVTMRLDLEQRTLLFSCEGHFKDQGFAEIPCGPHIHYRMAIRCNYNGDKIQLTNFSIA